MFEKLKMKAALKNAEKIREDRDKIAKVIAAEEKKLLKLIALRVEVDTALSEAETATALGETSDVDGARRKADSIMVAISRQSATLSGLRGRLASQAPELEAGVRGIQSGLPEHLDALKGDFKDEWDKGLAVFGKLLGRRAALEGLIGKLELAVPQPSACELGGEGAPWRAIDSLKAALEEIAGWSRAAFAPQVDAMGPGGARHFDPSAVYTITRAYDNLPAGSLVMESCFAPGLLQHLVNISDAVSLNSQQWAAGLEVGATAARELEAEAQSAARAAAAGPTAPAMTTAELRAAREVAAYNKSLISERPDAIVHMTV
jgi:hypothetical protein